MYVHLDFETRSDVELADVGSWNYSLHPSTYPLCMAYSFGDEEPVLWRLYDPEPQRLLAHIASGGIIKAHNASFEQAIWQNKCVSLFGWIEVPQKQWRCTAAKAAAHALPRALGACGKALGLSSVKDSEGHRVMLKLCKPRKKTEKDSAPYHNSAEDFKILYSYNLSDVRAERAIDNFLPDLTEYEQELWFYDQAINKRGVAVDLELVEKALKIIGIYAESYNNQINALTDGVIGTVGQISKILAWLNLSEMKRLSEGNVTTLEETALVTTWYNKKIPDNDKVLGLAEKLGGDVKQKLLLVPKLPYQTLDKKTIENLLEANQFENELCKQLVLLRQKGSKTSNKKYEAIKTSVCPDGRVRDCFLYHGASPGRWSGKLIQLHNLPTGANLDTEKAVGYIKTESISELEKMGDVTNVISSCIRGAFVPAQGKKFYAADYSAIEARLLIWSVGDVVGIKEFEDFDREKNKLLEPYRRMASRIFNKPVEDIEKTERDVGKMVILGLGFGMGSVKFKESCEQRGIKIDEDFANKVVQLYRNKYSLIKNQWYAIEEAAIKACMLPEFTASCGKFQFRRTGRFLYCKLPSGRKIAYCDPEIKMATTPWGEEKQQLHFKGVNTETKQWAEQHTYGGSLVENCIQAVARDLLAEAIISCEKNNYPVVMHTHDEVVVEVPEGFGSLKEFLGLMTNKPLWAKDCPIVAEGWEGHRYRK